MTHREDGMASVQLEVSCPYFSLYIFSFRCSGVEGKHGIA